MSTVTPITQPFPAEFGVKSAVKFTIKFSWPAAAALGRR
jgi:hypothetical protein